RAIRSFFIAEVDRDKVVLHGRPVSPAFGGVHDRGPSPPWRPRGLAADEDPAAALQRSLQGFGRSRVGESAAGANASRVMQTRHGMVVMGSAAVVEHPAGESVASAVGERLGEFVGQVAGGLGRIEQRRGAELLCARDARGGGAQVARAGRRAARR
ncbi:MAG: hypothetical protein WKF40_09370, partial [Thermoleophilaceae bacterium]